MASLEAIAAATDSASVVEAATVAWILLPQEIAPPGLDEGFPRRRASRFDVTGVVGAAVPKQRPLGAVDDAPVSRTLSVAHEGLGRRPMRLSWCANVAEQPSDGEADARPHACRQLQE